MSVLRDAARAIGLEKYIRWGRGEGQDACMDIRPGSCRMYGGLRRSGLSGRGN